MVCRVSPEWLGTGRGALSSEGDDLAEVATADAELVESKKKERSWVRS